jgi:hypothetical protein
MKVCHVMNIVKPYSGGGTVLLTECGKHIEMSPADETDDTWCIGATILQYVKDRRYTVCGACMDSPDFALMLLGRTL